MKQKLGYYPGCSLQSTAIEYDWSLRGACELLDLELQEIPDWNCCGASSAHSLNAMAGELLALRNLVLAEQAGLQQILVPCAACYNLQKTAEVNMRQGQAEFLAANDRMQQTSGCSYQGGVAVLHPLDFLNRPEITERILQQRKPLQGLHVAAYYGCLITRPSQVAFDDIEYPMSMDRILTKLGAQAVKWSYKTDCCGASLALTKTAVVEKFTAHFVAMARRAGAEAIVSACPLCHSNLDTRQTAGSGSMPVFYFSELLGISLGHRDAKQWLDKHIVDPLPLLQRLNIL
ncbi:MAG: glycolate oxidase iron-sulfur subunit [Firmicutes bacterium]|nr:glycolate oxidase iron-sulfur subunit [Bacillota bacterium]